MPTIRFWKGTVKELAEALGRYHGTSQQIPGLRVVDALSPSDLPEKPDELFVLHTRWPKEIFRRPPPFFVRRRAYITEPSVIGALGQWKTGRLFVYNDIDYTDWWAEELHDAIRRAGGIMLKTQVRRDQPDDQPVRWAPAVYEPATAILPHFQSNPVPWEKRHFDVSFVGDHQTGRRKAIVRGLLRARTGLNLFVSGRLDSASYAETVRESRAVLSLPGDGPRCRREWETLMAGSLLVLDEDSYQRHLHAPLIAGENCVGLPLASDPTGAMTKLESILKSPDAQTTASRGQALTTMWTENGRCPLWNQILQLVTNPTPRTTASIAR